MSGIVRWIRKTAMGGKIVAKSRYMQCQIVTTGLAAIMAILISKPEKK